MSSTGRCPFGSGPSTVTIRSGVCLCLPIARTPPFDSTWAFVLCEQTDGTTRLISRERYG